MSTPHWTDPDVPTVDYEMGGNDRLFLSEQGLIVLDPEGQIWECALSGYRIDTLPADAVEWRPVPAAPKCDREGCTSKGKLHVHINANELGIPHDDDGPEYGEKDLEED
jgi:hypothetical protein